MPIADHMIAEAHTRRRITQQRLKTRFSFKQRQAHQVLTVEIKQIKREGTKSGDRPAAA